MRTAAWPVSASAAWPESFRDHSCGTSPPLFVTSLYLTDGVFFQGIVSVQLQLWFKQSVDSLQLIHAAGQEQSVFRAELYGILALSRSRLHRTHPSAKARESPLRRPSNGPKRNLTCFKYAPAKPWRPRLTCGLQVATLLQPLKGPRSQCRFASLNATRRSAEGLRACSHENQKGAGPGRCVKGALHLPRLRAT